MEENETQPSSGKAEINDFILVIQGQEHESLAVKLISQSKRSKAPPLLRRGIYNARSSRILF